MSNMTQKRFAADIRRQMCYLGISPLEVAAAACMSDRTLRTKLKEPGRFTLDEMLSIARKLRLDISYSIKD